MISSKLSCSSSDNERSIVEASIHELAAALESRMITSVDLTAKYLQRISKYDCRGPSLNSIPLLNQDVFDEAAASDDRRAMNMTNGVLDGIPYTVKDSYKVRNMIVASGSHAFQGLMSNEDAFTVSALREAGAVLIGKTNMCPMAAGGMQRGLYGRAESPYNLQYLAAAFASGSSNGSGASTGASLAAFGMGEETVSSGRSPASNNGLVAYTPSRGLISIRGNWPLYPTCDVVVPHTRSMEDLFKLLDVITAEDIITRGDFWRHQTFAQITKSWSKPSGTFDSLTQGATLKGVRIAVPEMYIGGSQPRDASPVYTSESVQSLWAQARKELEAAGAVVIPVANFPAIHQYENPQSESQSQAPELACLPPNWIATERGSLIAHAWEDFLHANQDPNFPSIAGLEAKKIFPIVSSDHPQIKYSEPANAIHWSKLSSYLKSANDSVGENSSLYEIPNLEQAVKALESMRKRLFEDWLDENKFDLVVFPAAGDVGRADADVNHESAQHAWTNGVKYSNGNRALRHLGIPSVTVPMGLIEDKDMPVGLTFLGKAYEDTKIMQAAYVYEQISRKRTPPKLTPTLASDMISSSDGGDVIRDSSRPVLEITECTGVAQSPALDRATININGKVTTVSSSGTESLLPVLDIYVDGDKVDSSAITVSPQSSSCNGTAAKKPGTTTTRVFTFSCICTARLPPMQDERNKVTAKIARDSTMVVVLARAATSHHVAVNGNSTSTHGRQMMTRPSGWLGLIHRSEVQEARQILDRQRYVV